MTKGCDECGVGGGYALYCLSCAEKYVKPKWVELTENQIDKLEKEFIGFPVPNIYNFVKAIDAKLNDKNT